jgi:5'-3' exonuclease
MAQFPLLEEALEAMGVKVWAMVEYEADDALASAALRAASDGTVDRVLICTPDKDLAQCVQGARVVQFDRQRRILRDETGVAEKFGVRPESIPDYLALVGDSADGYPGLAGWGPKAASAALAKYTHIEQIPKDWRQWAIPVRGAEKLAASLFSQWEDVLLYRKLATLKKDAPVFESVSELAWRGPKPEFEALCERILAPGFPARAAAARR